MLNKNPNVDLVDFDEFIKEIMKGGLNFFYSDNAFVKSSFFEILTNYLDYHIFYFDFDLLFSGYVSAKITHVNTNKISIIRPDRNNWNDTLSNILQEISLQRSIVIIDSLNGFFTLFDEIESSKFVNSCIMLLKAIGSNTNSSIIVGAISKFKKDEGWFLVPTSRRIMESKNSNRYFLREFDSFIIIDEIKKSLVVRSTKVSVQGKRWE